jgi:hypothetical protein
MHTVAYGIEGCGGEDDKPSLKTIKVWKIFTAQFRREHDAIPRNTTMSVTNVCGLDMVFNSSSAVPKTLIWP